MTSSGLVNGDLVLLQSRPVTTEIRGIPHGPLYGPGPVAETFPDPDAVRAGTAPIRTGVKVTAAPDGSSVASLDLRGHLCAATAPALHGEVAQLIADGVSQISIELGLLDPCETYGVAAPRLVGASDAHAEVVAAAAAAVVAGVFDAMADAGSAVTFDIPADAGRLAVLRGGAPAPEVMTPYERPGDSRS